MTARPPLRVMRPEPGAPLPASVVDIDPLMTAEQVAAFLTVRVKRVYELGIPTVRLSARSVRWRRADLLAWLESRRAA